MPPVPPEQCSPYPGGRAKQQKKVAEPHVSAVVGPVERHGDRASGGDEPAPTRFLSGPQVQRRYGITDVTLWRWLNDPKSKVKNFPRPLVINKRRYWREDQLADWERNRVRSTLKAATQ